MIQFAGGVRRPVTLRAPDFRLDVDELEAAVTDRTRLILLNSPHNPTGTRARPATSCRPSPTSPIEHDLVVVTDEVYEHLAFDDHDARAARTLPGMFERTVTHLQRRQDVLVHRLEDRLGHRAGRSGRPRWWPRRSGCPSPRGAPLQPAIAHALDHEGGFHDALRDDLQTRRDLLCDGLADARHGRARPAGHLLRDHRRRRARLCGRDGVLPARCPSAPAWWRSRPRPSTRTSTTGRHLVRWAFCKEPDVIEDGPAQAAGGRPARLTRPAGAG